MSGPDHARGRGSAKAKEEGRLRYQDFVPEKEEILPGEMEIGGKPSQPKWIQEILDKAAKEQTTGEERGPLNREFDYRGRRIQIETSYAITVNGEPFQGHITLGNDGRVYSHSCPYLDFPSVVELMKYLIDLYPGNFEPHGVTRDCPADSHEDEYQPEA